MIKEYLDREKHVDPDLKWKHFKKKLKNDERYELIESSSERERLFEKTLEEYLVERRKGKRRSKSREREESKRPHFSEKDDPEKRLKKMKRMEAIENFKVLLAERIKTYDIDYHDAKKLISDDHRYKSEELDSDDRRDLFENFIKDKQRDAITNFRNLLQEKRDEFDPSTTFEQAVKILGSDKRLHQFLILTDKDVKRIYEDFIEKVKDEAYTGFERFLQETPLLNKDSPLEGEGFQELLEKLSKDLRYQRAEFMSEKREKLIKQRINFLKEEFERKQAELAKNPEGFSGLY